MSPKINLLPYRAEQRKAVAKRFFTFLGLGAAVAVAVMMLVHSFYNLKLTNQETRNNYLETEIASLNKQIDEIKRLKEETAAMIARKQVVESLQANRSRAVMLLNQIVQPPPGIFYKAVKQTGGVMVMTGIATTNTAVSTLIKQLETSDILQAPKLIETKAVTIEGAKLVEFTLQTTLLDLAKIAQDKEKENAKNKAVAAPATGAPTSPAPTPAH